MSIDKGESSAAGQGRLFCRCPAVIAKDTGLAADPTINGLDQAPAVATVLDQLVGAVVPLAIGLLLVSRTPGLGVMVKPEVLHAASQVRT